MHRSFDAFQMIRIPDQGIFWKGMYATYLTPIPPEHLRAARASRWRQMVFHGEVRELPLSTRRSVVDFAVQQSQLGE